MRGRRRSAAFTSAASLYFTEDQSMKHLCTAKTSRAQTRGLSGQCTRGCASVGSRTKVAARPVRAGVVPLSSMSRRARPPRLGRATTVSPWPT
eukprot:8423758-Lingulodinium_polyedra.AAC.1